MHCQLISKATCVGPLPGSLSELSSLGWIGLKGVDLGTLPEAAKKPERIAVVLMEACCLHRPWVRQSVDACPNIYQSHILVRGDASKKEWERDGEPLEAEVQR
eukprot:scaffold303548_cov32-Tisochrysis_lutea.AAC.1